MIESTRISARERDHFAAISGTKVRVLGRFIGRQQRQSQQR
jgi:hypothetical protein